MNLANKITMFRVVMIPVFLVFCYLDFPASNYIALAIFILASLSDFADGQIARRQNLVTDFGKFMDPLADKVLVTAAMLMFVEWGQMPAWVLAVVIAREFAVSGMRMMAATDGKVIAAAVFDGANPLDLGLDGIHDPHIQNPPDQRGLPVHRRQNTLQRLVGWYLVAAFLSAQPHNGIGEQRIIAGYLKFHNIWILRFQNYTS